MLRNFFLTAYRTFLRNKTYSILGILGLTLSISCVLSIYTIINFQSGFDQHQENYSKLYRIISHYEKGDNEYRTSTVQHPLSSAIKGQISGVEYVSNTYMWFSQVTIPMKDGSIKKLEQNNIGFVESDITELITINWLAGNADIGDQSKIMISKNTAERYFNVTEGFESVLGKEIIIGNEHRLVVSGVYDDFPKNTDYPFELLTAYGNQEGINNYFNGGKNWAGLNGGTECLIKIADGAIIEDISASLNEIYNEHNRIEGFSLVLQPMSTIHTLPYGNYSGTAFESKYILISVVMMIFLALIGCINFINLSTARAITRTKEVGIRKIMGGKRNYLIFQFLVESFMIVSVSFVIGFFLAEQILNGFNQLIDSDLNLKDVSVWDWVTFTSISVLAITLLSGLYPAFVLSGFSPLNALKIKTSNIDRFSVIPTRKILVGLQFAFSVILVFGASVMYYQINFMKNEDLGFQSDGIVSVMFSNADYAGQQAFKNALISTGKVENISFCLASPMAQSNNTGKYYNPEIGPQDEVSVNEKMIDENYLDLFEIELLTGRNLNPGDHEKKNVLVNEQFLLELKLGNPSEALGKTFKPGYSDEQVFKIVGVVKDFHSYSLKGDLSPVFLEYKKDMFFQAAIKLKDTSKAGTKEAMTAIESSWEKVFPKYLIKYAFLDEMMARFYKFEEVMVKSISFFVIITIIVCAMGLYGLTDYIANAKRKELGIRKVVGANLSQLLMTFVKEVLPTILLALSLSGTISYLLMNQWLNQFTYRIDIGWQIIALTVTIVFLIVGISMGYRSFLATRLNPVDVLKDE